MPDCLLSSLVQSIPTKSAILDLKFSLHNDSVLCAATSTGSLLICECNTSQPRPENPTGELAHPNIKSMTCLQYFDYDVLLLSCSWHPSLPGIVGVTLSNGGVYLLKLPSKHTRKETDHPQPNILQKTFLHSDGLEVWTLSFSPGGEEIYSGSDSGILRLHVLNSFDWTFPDASITTNESTLSPHTLREDRRIHNAGVTAILYVTHNIIVTGSYDDNIRIVKKPPTGRCQVLAEKNLGGGVWRLSRMKSANDNRIECRPTIESFDILASCMHAGVRVLRIAEESVDSWTIVVLATFEEHQSMNYDSVMLPQSTTQDIQVISASFYDCLVCLWTYILDISK